MPISLDEDESRHCIRTLRLKVNDPIKLIDGKGNIFTAKIIEANPKRCQVEITNKETIQKKPFYSHMAIAPTKNMNRFEWFVEKATELGVDEITPLICNHSERKKINHDRLEKIIISALKQSRNPYKPILNSLLLFSGFIKKHFGQDSKFIAYCNEENKTLSSLYKRGENAVILIGPEGDFDQEEIDQATMNGFIPVSLGMNRYRTETAGIMSCQTINLLNE